MRTRRSSSVPFALALALASLLGLFACDLFFDPPPDPPPPDVADCTAPARPCPDWRCAEGTLVVTYTNATAGKVEGLFSSAAPQSLAEVKVESLPGGGARAHFKTFSGCELTATVTSHTEASFVFNGVTVDGLGALTEAEQGALASLKQSALIDAVTQGPLGAGCVPEVPPAHEAALLFPLQVLLKYDEAPGSREAALRALGANGDCKYFSERRTDDRKDATRMGPLRLGGDHPLPAVFAYDLLDLAGATEPPGSPLEGELLGPCGAKCRGACGADCALTNCREIVNYRCEVLPDGGKEPIDQVTMDCGVHDGCVEHDDCYDACNKSHGCGSWKSFKCMRGCDKAAADKWGYDNGYEWAQGFGPFMRRVSFVYRRPGNPWICAPSCVAAGTPVRLFDGIEVPIEKVRSGDRVLAYDFEQGELTQAVVEALWVHQGDFPLQKLAFSSGQLLEVTGNHPIWTVDHGYRPVDELRPGDRVLVANPALQATVQETVVEVVRRHSQSSVVYNLKTTREHYFAADVLVHNKCLSAESRVDTPLGPVAIARLEPGQLVWGSRAGERVLTRVRSVFRKQTLLRTLPGRALGQGLVATESHRVLKGEGSVRVATLAASPVEIAGPVFDLETESGNYFAGGLLLEAASGF